MIRRMILTLSAMMLASPVLAEPYLVAYVQQSCDNCKAMQPITDELTREGWDIRLISVDDPKNLVTAQRFGVKYTPTYMVIEQNQFDPTKNGGTFKRIAAAYGKGTKVQLVKLMSRAGMKPTPPAGSGKMPEKPKPSDVK